jgi:hypothetical protein
VSRHAKGDRNYTTEIHKLLTLELIHRRFIDNPERNDFRGKSALPVTASSRH